MNKRYEIQSLTPANGFSAVWSHDYGGSVQVDVRPLDFIATALVQEYQHGKWVDTETDVVGVALGDGFFEVVDENANCHGIVRDGASCDECLDLLLPELRSRVIKPVGNTDLKRSGKKGDLLNV
jgi:hypothetical protein